MTIKQLWSIIRGRRTNFRCLNISWTYYPDGDPLSKPAPSPTPSTLTVGDSETIENKEGGA